MQIIITEIHSITEITVFLGKVVVGVGDSYDRTLFFKLVTEIESILKLMIGWVQDLPLFCFLGSKCYVFT